MIFPRRKREHHRRIFTKVAVLLEKSFLSSGFSLLALWISGVLRKESMLKARSFSDIFEEIHEPTPEIETTQTSWNAGWETALEPAGLSQLIGSLQPMKNSRSHIYRYPRVPRPAHALNAEEQAAYSFLCSFLNKPLNPGFYAAELKSAYRQALLKTHPDQGGTAETFQQVRKSYQILEAFVKNKA